MGELTIEQRRALALARARMRVSEGKAPQQEAPREDRSAIADVGRAAARGFGRFVEERVPKIPGGIAEAGLSQIIPAIAASSPFVGALASPFLNAATKTAAPEVNKALEPAMKPVREFGKDITKSVKPRQRGDVYQEYERGGLGAAIASLAETGAESSFPTVAGLVTAAATRNPRLATAVMGAGIVPETYLGIRETQAQEGTNDVGRAVAGTAASSAFDLLTGASGAVRSLGRETVEEALKRGVIAAAKRVSETGVKEFGTEILQNIIEQVAGGADPTTKQALLDTLEAGMVGTVTGGGVGVAAEGVRALQNRGAAPQPTPTPEAAAPKPTQPDAETERRIAAYLNVGYPRQYAEEMVAADTLREAEEQRRAEEKKAAAEAAAVPPTPEAAAPIEEPRRALKPITDKQVKSAKDWVRADMMAFPEDMLRQPTDEELEQAARELAQDPYVGPMDMLNAVMERNDARGAAPAPMGETPGTFRTEYEINGETQVVEGPTTPAADQTVEGVATPVAPKAMPAPSDTGLAEMGGGMASGIGENFRTMLLAKVEAGDVTENGQPSTILEAAKIIKDAGVPVDASMLERIQTAIDDARQTNNFQAAMRAFVTDTIQRAQAAPKKPTLGTYNQASRDFEAGLITRDEFRAKAGLPPVSELPDLTAFEKKVATKRQQLAEQQAAPEQVAEPEVAPEALAAEPVAAPEAEIDYESHPLMVEHNAKFDDYVSGVEDIENVNTLRARARKFIKEGILDEGVMDDINEAMADEEPGYRAETGRDRLIDALEDARSEAAYGIEYEIDREAEANAPATPAAPEEVSDELTFDAVEEEVNSALDAGEITEAAANILKGRINSAWDALAAGETPKYTPEDIISALDSVAKPQVSAQQAAPEQVAPEAAVPEEVAPEAVAPEAMGQPVTLTPYENTAMSVQYYKGGMRTGIVGKQKPSWLPDVTRLYESIGIDGRTLGDKSDVRVTNLTGKNGEPITAVTASVRSVDEVYGDRGNTAAATVWTRSAEPADIESAAQTAEAIARWVANPKNSKVADGPLNQIADRALKFIAERGGTPIPEQAAPEQPPVSPQVASTAEALAAMPSEEAPQAQPKSNVAEPAPKPAPKKRVKKTAEEVAEADRKIAEKMAGYRAQLGTAQSMEGSGLMDPLAESYDAHDVEDKSGFIRNAFDNFFRNADYANLRMQLFRLPTRELVLDAERISNRGEGWGKAPIREAYDISDRAQGLRATLLNAGGRLQEDVDSFIGDKGVRKYADAKKRQNSLFFMLDFARALAFNPAEHAGLNDALVNDGVIKAAKDKLTAAKRPQEQGKARKQIKEREDMIRRAWMYWDKLGEYPGGHETFSKIVDYYATLTRATRNEIDGLVRAIRSVIGDENADAISAIIRDADEGFDEAPKEALKGDIFDDIPTRAFPVVYVPWNRFGKYVLQIKPGTEGYPVGYRGQFDTLAEREAEAKRIATRLGTNPNDANVFERHSDPNRAAQDNATESTVIRNVLNVIRNAELNVSGDTVMNEDSRDAAARALKADLEKQLTELLLTALPEESIRKQFIRAKGIPGRSGDHTRVLAYNVQRYANQLPRLKFGYQLNNKLEAAQDELKGAEDSQGKEMARILIDEISNRLREGLNPPINNPLVAAVNSFGYTMLLSAPASAINNATVTWQRAAFELSTEYGPKAATTLARLEGVMRLMGSVHDDPTGNVRKYYAPSVLKLPLIYKNPTYQKAFLELRDIYNAFGHGFVSDIVMQGRTSSVRPRGVGGYVMDNVRKIADVVNAPFGVIERITNEKIGMAAFMLEHDKQKAAGKTDTEAFNAAIDKARAIVKDTVGAYGAAERPPLFKGPGTLLLLFKSFSLNLGAFVERQYSKLLYQPMAAMGDIARGQMPKKRSVFTPAEKRQATKLLMALYAGNFLWTGVSGMFGFGVMAKMLAPFIFMFMDDDEREEWARENPEYVNNMPGYIIEKLIPETFGGYADTIAYGPASALTGVNLSARIGYDNLFFKDPVMKTGDTWNDTKSWFMDNFAAGVGRADEFMKGANFLMEGNVSQAVKRMVPAAIGAPTKAITAFNEGIKDARGREIVRPEEFTLPMAVKMAFGYQPIEVTKTYSRLYGSMEQLGAIKAEGSKLLRALNDAEAAGDYDRVAEVEEQIEDFNALYPGSAITDETKERSQRAYKSREGRLYRGMELKGDDRERIEADIENYWNEEE